MTEMTPERLDEIETRAEAATPGGPEGPGVWHYERSRLFGVGFDVMTDQYFAEIVLNTRDEENAVFIAHARQDVPDLVAEVRRLQRELAAAESFVADLPRGD